MGTDIEKLVDLMIQERMQSQFAKWREAETGKEKKADYLRLETEYEKAISVLSEEQKDAPANGSKAVQRYRLGGFFSTCVSSAWAHSTAAAWPSPSCCWDF